MAVTEQTPRNVSTATAGATVFPYSFKIVSKGDLRVEVDGVAKTVDVDFTVSGVGSDAGGNVTFITPLVGGETVARVRSMKYARPTDYQNLGDLRSATLNNDQDASVLMVQQLAEAAERSLRVPVAYGGSVNAELPAPAALKPLVWNAAGTALENGSTELTGDMLLRGELASSDAGKGAALVEFRDTLGTAYLKTVSDIINGSPVSVHRFIAPAQHAAIRARTTTYDARPDLNTALASGARGLIVPAGLYLVGGALTRASGKSISITGDGPFSSTLRFTAAGGLNITLDDYIERANISGLDFQAAAVAAGDAIFVTAPSVASNNMQNLAIQDVQIWSDLGSSYWNRGIIVNNCWHFLLKNVLWKGASAQANWGDFIELAGRSLDGRISDVHGTGANRGVHINSEVVEGLRIDESTFVAVRKGVFKPTGASRPPHYSIRGTHIAAQQSCIELNSVSSAFITDNLLYLGTQAGETVPADSPCVFVNDAAGVKIRGNQASGRDAGIPTTRHGYVVSSTVSNFHITENYADLFSNGVWIQSGNTGPGRVADNDYLLNTNNLLDQSASGVSVTESGGVMPRHTKQSIVLARLSAAVLNVTGDATPYTVLFDEVSDNTGEYVPASGVFTAARAGKYHIAANILLTGLAAAHTDGKIQINAGGASYEGHGNPAAGKTTFGWQTMHHEVCVSLTAGQTVVVNAIVSNGTKVVGIGAGSSLTIRYEAE